MRAAIDSPSVARARLELAGRLGASHTPGRILSANADTQEEAVCDQGGDHAAQGPSGAVCASRQGGKDEELYHEVSIGSDPVSVADGQ